MTKGIRPFHSLLTKFEFEDVRKRCNAGMITLISGFYCYIPQMGCLLIAHQRYQLPPPPPEQLGSVAPTLGGRRRRAMVNSLNSGSISPRWSPGRSTAFCSWEDTLFSQCLSPPRCIKVFTEFNLFVIRCFTSNLCGFVGVDIRDPK